ncbi:MAG: COX15/CtaA family protein [Candidatus Competibacteraceae bacterium]|nr:COX15/CtaA family protein [Candidatus Competibacteraceae bacterium]MBK7982722.1 COX15/CtaA family protein [Candidatus Competibacteraceae bacterium]MBK8898731.1 COX15/CtaA family protein [Candidatus Competibacteraceae bacterium]MBK8962531.1 COX15/CtaA family protein [Candidatus Competibacteraceae bacterium]MBK9951745.1 COX15/CtaA family protein [Candidatus Competibacteraceae bacterium]
MTGIRKTLFHRLAWAALALTFVVVVLGAYVRLSDAGLGCPDWPGCYGQLDVPDEAQQIARANDAYPHRPVEPAKAWKEMVHRYFAGTLGVLVLTLAVLAWRNRSSGHQPVALPLFLLGLIVFQALLGMWTVTWQLKPVVVMAHLLGGLATLSLLAWLVLRQGGYGLEAVAVDHRPLRNYALLGLALLVAQIALGGWTSANYAALACPDFPTCQSHWWPPTDFKEAFTLWRGLGVSYEGGVLANDARVTIHLMHRLGALVVLLYLGWLSWRLLRADHSRALRSIGLVVAALLAGQLALGIANVLLRLPLPVAAAHNGGAALLLLALVALNHLVRPETTA